MSLISPVEEKLSSRFLMITLLSFILYCIVIWTVNSFIIKKYKYNKNVAYSIYLILTVIYFIITSVLIHV